MAHLITLTDTITQVDLAVASGTGIRLLDFALPALTITEDRTDPTASAYGQRSSSDAMVEQWIAYTGRIYGTSPDNVIAQLRALTIILNNVRVREQVGSGPAVRVNVKRQGETSESTWRVTGVKLPRPSSSSDVWDRETLNNQLTFTMSLRIEPMAHPTVITNRLVATTTWQNQPAQNILTTQAMLGELESPLNVAVKRTGGSDPWTSAIICQLAKTPNATDATGASDAAAHNNTVKSTPSITAPVSTGVITTIAAHAAMAWPARGFVRMKVTAGDPTKLRARMRVRLGNNQFAYTPWVPTTAPINIFTLLDLGASRHAAALLERMNTSSSTAYYEVEYTSTDGSSITVSTDYMEVLYVQGIARLNSLAVTGTHSLVYEDVQSSSGIAFPREVPDAYQIDGTGTFHQSAQLTGRLRFQQAGAVAYVWIATWNATYAHNIADAGTIKVDQLPTYSMGLRGNG